MRGIASDMMLNFLAVNQRGRQSDNRFAAYENRMGTLPLVTGKEDRNHPDQFLKTIINRRKQGLSCGLDVCFTNAIFRIGSLAHRLSFLTRKKLLYPLLTIKNTLFLSNAGIILPSMDKNGGLTGDSAIAEVGDLEILDIFLSLGCVRTWPLGLVTQSFRRKLYMEFLSCGNLFTEKNVVEFNQLFRKTLTDYL
ncbi:hypothetical protein [Desulfatirhabdium butyrativorans]|uniref:hypothetical protein n=1 Tax=Desulfatirhabdium butyrativorans TaxID=340467 RepID=UPI00047F407C|nr:hypothetical protein [Desulfatirhabdium butyrativorans]